MDDQTTGGGTGTEELEPEIIDAYRSLSMPTSPPDDLLVRVERGIRRRRTARRGLVGVAAVLVVGTAGMLVLGGDEGPEGTTATDRPSTAETSTLTFTDVDGSTYTFAPGDIAVTCTTSTTGDGKEITSVVLARNDAIAAMQGDDFPNDEMVTPVLHVDVHVDGIELGKELTLPYDVDSDSENRPFTFFFTSADRAKGRNNELSSAEAGSSGTVTVHQASCGDTPTLSLEIDGILGSEVNQPALAITGEYRS